MGVLMERMAEASANEPRAGTVFSIILSMISMAVLAICMTRRVQNVQDWSRYPLVCWLYYSSIVKTTHQRSALPLQLDWIANSLLCSHRVEFYLVSVAPNLCWKGALVDLDSKADSPIMKTAFDILVNVYLTSLFLVPLQGLYSYKNNPNSQTRTVALRTFIGSCCALTSSVVNLTLLLVLRGEPGWICLMCCNLDILFSVLVLHWITSKDNASTFLPRRSQSHTHSHTRSYPTIRTSGLPSPTSPRPLISSPRSTPENMGFSNRDRMFTSICGINGAKPDDYSYARDAIDLPTVTTTVTAGVGVEDTVDGEDEGKYRGLGNGNGETGIRKPKMAITVERDHVREVVETGIRIVNDRDYERLILTLPRSISGGGGSIGIEIGDEEKERGNGRIGEEDDTDISF
ncbi:uncharacterized protein Bfra_011695 [Botrytis fragariae]|uniref:Transmembrane protein n=1 Tax=Botrytis fragariae TaxID=1964551 RepID=A0A8H6AK87_9HELO|nr:uncharacterized protein Bfra_011695 [Botrytis fragariae]KAF5869152.1 hypothetical protein Bfra_011695 [Botrytis fragariae]